MNCPKCKETMEFEELKNWYGFWYCECGYEAPGSHIPCDAEYFTDSPNPVVCDYEDRIEA